MTDYTTPPFVPFDTEELHLLDARQKKHREVLKARLKQSGIELNSIEYAIRVMIMQGRFDDTVGIPETMLMPSLPAFVFESSSPFMTVSDIASSIPWLLRVHQTMQWVQTMPIGITTQSFICPAALHGKIANSKGILGIDWNIIDNIVFRTKKSMRRKRRNATRIAKTDQARESPGASLVTARLETPPPDSLSVPTAPTTTTTTVPLESKLATMALASSIPESSVGGETTCIICMTNPKTHLAAPCGHQCVCSICSTKLQECPYCREPVAMWVKIHLV